MCCCPKPSINGEPHAYSWDGKYTSTHPVNPPALHEGDEVLHDEPGRCGGVDSHSHHFMLVKQRYGGFAILVRHGGGDRRISLGHRNYIVGVMAKLDSNARYWLMLGVYHVHSEAERVTTEEITTMWRKAAADKRIKTRKQPRRNAVKVWIEPEQVAS